MMNHRGYGGNAWIDHDAGVIRGVVVGLKDVITFQGATVEEARSAFEESVDDYLAFCAERGEEPEKPFSGKLLVRLDPELHRQLSMAAEASGMSINALVAEILRDGLKPKPPGRSEAAVGSAQVLVAPKRPSKRRPSRAG